jgi:type IV secretory pathway VirD2 relaxase
LRHFLFEDKDYEYRPTFRRRKEKKDSVAEFARILRAFGGRRGNRSPARMAARRQDLRQKCIAKMQYSKSVEAHRVQLEKYLTREGTDRDGNAAELFGTDLEEYKKHMVGKHIRLFLSPQSLNVDTKILAEQFIKKLEKQTGYKFYWQGACHFNTAHPHAHLLINGVDKNGIEVDIQPDIVKTFMRETARDICTSQVGLRTQKDLDLEKEQELSAHRFTRLDNYIQEISGGPGGLRVSALEPFKDKERVLARLETLRKLNLCTYENNGYTLKSNWQEGLKANSKYNVFLKAREELHYSDSPAMKIYTGEQGIVTRKVTKIYRTDDDASDNHVVVLEALDGKAYFIPLLKRPELYDKGIKSLLKEGELISLKAYKSQKGRLTPVLFKRELRSIKKEIRQNNYSGKLSSELRNMKTPIFGVTNINLGPKPKKTK